MEIMSDFRETVADRLERAADRMYNAGFLVEERRYRDAAAEIRAGLSLEETQALERRMLTDPHPGLLHRLSALAAPGEHDDPGAETQTPPDEPILTAVPNGLSDSFDSALGAWISYTGVSGQDVNSFTGNQNTDPFTGGPSTSLLSSPLLVSRQ